MTHFHVTKKSEFLVHFLNMYIFFLSKIASNNTWFKQCVWMPSKQISCDKKRNDHFYNIFLFLIFPLRKKLKCNFSQIFNFLIWINVRFCSQTERPYVTQGGYAHGEPTKDKSVDQNKKKTFAFSCVYGLLLFRLVVSLDCQLKCDQRNTHHLSLFYEMVFYYMDKLYITLWAFICLNMEIKMTQNKNNSWDWKKEEKKIHVTQTFLVQ